jgi:glutathione S-transferase
MDLEQDLTPGNPRVCRVQAAAALAGVELQLNEVKTGEHKTEEFVKKNPLQYLPFLEDGDLAIAESAAIAEYGECFFCSRSRFFGFP